MPVWPEPLRFHGDRNKTAHTYKVCAGPVAQLVNESAGALPRLVVRAQVRGAPRARYLTLLTGMACGRWQRPRSRSVDISERVRPCPAVRHVKLSALNPVGNQELHDRTVKVRINATSYA